LFMDSPLPLIGSLVIYYNKPVLTDYLPSTQSCNHWWLLAYKHQRIIAGR
jgi:hypothetical protein